ncbi:hypothetical protein O6H91_16G089700 [Diphasiastrum complanatum]|uniref:Uncharacterized protein n=1 Tax=Diphasiastrum complanatum TaxID=34168 RepID=A0ACC2BER8_DIPCM|nr:hypothetical protein O6H91_16G089700 [Diphasiastrum complanatum]
MASESNRSAGNLCMLQSYKLIFSRTREFTANHDQLTNVMQAIGFTNAIDVCYNESSGIFWRPHYVPSSPWEPCTRGRSWKLRCREQWFARLGHRTTDSRHHSWSTSNFEQFIGDALSFVMFGLRYYCKQ